MSKSRSDGPKGTAIYSRVSTGAQKDEGTSLGSQEDRCRDKARELGLQIDERYVYGEVFTGTELWDRPQLSSLREAVRHGEVGHVIVYATDRLARDPIHLAIVADECERHGVNLVFVSEPLDTTPEGALIRYVKGYAAKIEHEKIRERTLRGKREYAKRGQLHNHSVELYGYRRDKEARTRAVCEPEAAVIRHIFRWVAEDHVPVRTIVRQLNDAGTPSPGAGKFQYQEAARTPRWGRGVLNRILHNSSYMGETYAWRYQAGGAGHSVDRPQSEWIKLPDGVTPAIVSPELYQAAQDHLATNHGEDQRNKARPYLLRGFVFCAVCGRRMHASPEHANRTYRCSSRDTASGPCGGKRTPAEDLEAWVWGHVSAVLRDPSIIAAEIERQRAEGPDQTMTADLETAKREFAKLTKQQERLVRRMREGSDDSFPWELIEREIASIEQEKRQIQAAISDLEARLGQQLAAVEQLGALSEYCDTVSGRLGDFGFDEQRLAFEALGIQVRANGAMNSPDWQVSGSIPVGSGGGPPTTSARCGPPPPRSPEPA